MIPLTLKLKNFLSYGADLQTIDFTPYPLICLSGKNGHGKSALLDAITWAIWGAARKESAATRADQGLIRLGQTSMLVVLDFSCNGNHYRVRREYTKSFGKQYVTLDFGMVDDNTDKLMPLTEKTVRATQNKIETTLNLTFESFVNSAFLRQGNANEFSKKTPRDRKHILAAILGINRYDTIKTLAMEKIKQATGQRTTLAALQTTAKQELDATAHLATQLQELESTLAQLSTKETAINNQLQSMAQEYATRMQEHQEYHILKAHLEHNATEEQQLLEKIRALRHAWQKIHSDLLRLPDTTQLEEKKHALMGILTEHQQLFAQQLTLKEELLRSKEELQTREKELSALSNKLIYEKQARLENLRAQTQSLKQTLLQTQSNATTTARENENLRKEYATMQERYLSIARELEKALPQEKQFEKRKEFYQQCIEQGKVSQHELALLQQKKLLVHDEDNPSCPLCEQNLSGSRKRFLKKTFEEQELALARRIKRLTAVVKKLKQLLMEQHANLEQFKVLRQQQVHLQATCQERLSQITKQEALQAEQTQAIIHHEKALASTIIELQTTEKELTLLHEQGIQEKHKDARYETLKSACTNIEQRLGQLTYDQKTHDKISKELQDLANQLALLKNTIDQKPLQEEKKHEIHTLIGTIKKLRERSRDLTQRSMVYAHLPAKLAELSLQQKTLELERKSINEQKENVLREKGKIENAQEKRLQFEKTYADYTTQQTSITELIDDYSIIASATGKDGIQALLIDEALPEIEQETNILLSKLTNNQTHLCIESLRDLKKGGTRETLDINISDPTGIRSYELFSGGEAFRIDFALRIAIAKLLARRAGTALQTLIIDEGFGSQDEEGLAHIMDAVYKIQDDFAKIIIVSHLSSMKDQFPVHFFIEKTPSGSQVNVIENY